MAEIRPFRGIRFSPAYAQSRWLLSPPYDVIDEAGVRRLYAADSGNIVRIDFGLAYPTDVPGENDRYTRARDYLTEWFRRGVLIRDRKPSIYVSEHCFTSSDTDESVTRRGILAGIPPLPWSDGQLRPHERTMAGPKQDRLRLLNTTGVQTSPVFALWHGDLGHVEAILNQFTGSRRPVELKLQGERGQESVRLWTIDDPASIRALASALRPSILYVADGHHRYETVVSYLQDRPAEQKASVLTYLCSAGDPNLAILATHRLVHTPVPNAKEFTDRLAAIDPSWAGVTVETLELLDQPLAREGRQSMILAWTQERLLLSRPIPPSASPMERLPVYALHAQVLPALGVSSDPNARQVSFMRGHEEALEAVHSGTASLAVLLPACTPVQIMDVADAGEIMPPKSTYFYPKVPTGLVMAPV